MLTMADSLGETNELQALACEVRRRRHGALRLRFRNEWRHGEVDYERGLVRREPRQRRPA